MIALSTAVLALTLTQANVEAVPATMLVLTAEKTKADATAALGAFERARKDWPFFKFEPGWPQIVESAKVPGFKAGTFVVALGVCFPPEAEPVWGALNVLEPKVSAKPVTWPTPLSCPQGAGRWSWGTVGSSKSKELELRAVAFQEGDDKLLLAARAESKSGSKVRLLEAIEQCQPVPFAAGKSELSMEVQCVVGRCAKAGHSVFKLAVVVHDGVPALDTKLLRVINPAKCD